jgi:hypothetical protein
MRQVYKKRFQMTYRKDDFSVKVDKTVLLRLHENAHDIGTVEHLQVKQI